ncbi:sulfur carrier protein ThiS [Phocaeicola faecicola]|jgi:sulfur carrier protein|uniref:sulfur carrier protein ThiS n=1 Tax=Phocaeicola faecicola TaxID=2739389 RepID=UPI0015B7705E|nr:sulfur carrier protein ThiS [Phocaeicola faecicola]MCI5743098.1 sulfur carrier protein ThiS [Bacteroides sp.]MDD6907480.1 sulfur carrier protein ThiS [Bacteroidaceae bacterium]MDY4871335.1 sulfur carrier protein ThiS [Phocaeicola faecicola]
MKVLVNNKETELNGSTVADLVRELALPEKGVAIALQNRIVPRTQWEQQPLQEGDSLVIIKAACGG